MRHLVDGRKFGINTSHRKAMFRALANNLILHEQIKTTVPKAKELKRVVDRLITLGKKGNLHSKRLAFDRTRDRATVVKLFDVLSERYAKRSGGYTRLLKMDGVRWGDAAEIAVIELVDRPLVEKKKAKKKATSAAHKHHDHDHEGGKKAGGAKASRAGWLGGAGKGKVGEASAKGKSAKASTVRKTPTQSGGGKSGGAS